GPVPGRAGADHGDGPRFGQDAQDVAVWIAVVVHEEGYSKPRPPAKRPQNEPSVERVESTRLSKPASFSPWMICWTCSRLRVSTMTSMSACLAGTSAKSRWW